MWHSTSLKCHGWSAGCHAGLKLCPLNIHRMSTPPIRRSWGPMRQTSGRRTAQSLCSRRCRQRKPRASRCRASPKVSDARCSSQVGATSTSCCTGAVIESPCDLTPIPGAVCWTRHPLQPAWIMCSWPCTPCPPGELGRLAVSSGAGGCCTGWRGHHQAPALQRVPRVPRSNSAASTPALP